MPPHYFIVMSRPFERESDEPVADPERSHREGDCVAVGWTTEERRELYGVEWEGTARRCGLWGTLRALFGR